MSASPRAAVFLDRDGTLIHDHHFIGRPEQVELLPGAAAAVQRLNRANVPAIVITNQSGIARGYFTEDDYHGVDNRLRELLSNAGARIDAAYFCPHYPDVSGPCECRKPGTLLYRRAAEDGSLDLARSFYVGDRLRDVAAARELGGTGILVPSPETDGLEQARREFVVVASLGEAVDRVLESVR